jgi:hypothetical protein
MVDGRPATQFVASFGGLLEDSFDSQRARTGIHAGVDAD